MSLSDKMAKASASVVAPKAPQAPVANGVKKTGATGKGAEFRAMGQKSRANMSEDQKALEGSKSDKVVLIATLGNPAKGQPRKVGGTYVPSKQVCGYQIKVLEDTQIPVAPLKENCKDHLDVTFPATERTAKAGEIVNLNVVEMAMLISRVEYAGTFSGEGVTATLSATISASRKDPAPCLRTSGGSIKENMIMVADMVGQHDGKGGHAEVKEEFKAFAPLFRPRSASRSGSGNSRKSGESTKATAAAFRALYARK